MAQQKNKIGERLKVIEIEQLKLAKEEATLKKLQALLGPWQHILRNDDTYSSKTASKFEVLAKVAGYLCRDGPFLYGGASTKEIFEGISSDLPSDGWERTQEESLNYNTFRSYMARFRAEERIYFDEKRRRWRLTKEPQSVARRDDNSDDHYD